MKSAKKIVKIIVTMDKPSLDPMLEFSVTLAPEFEFSDKRALRKNTHYIIARPIPAQGKTRFEIPIQSFHWQAKGTYRLNDIGMAPNGRIGGYYWRKRSGEYSGPVEKVRDQLKDLKLNLN